MEHRLTPLRPPLTGLALLLALAFTLLAPQTAYASGYANAGLLVETSALTGRLADENLRVIDVRPRRPTPRVIFPVPYISAPTT